MTANFNANPDDLTREPFYLPPRDFVGYGFDTPKDCWPNGYKIAVSFVLNYEELVFSLPVWSLTLTAQRR
jgi:hypothetical protein